jgi:DNA processing protein
MRLADLVALSLLPRSRRQLARAATDADAIDGTLDAALARLGPRDLPAVGRLRQDAAGALAAAERAGLGVVGWHEEAYSLALRQIADPPLVLWTRGTLPPPRLLAVAVVGSRAASPGAGEVARRLAFGLAGRGVAVVSGLARGCDGEAHRGAIAGGGVTVAVLGSGADVIYPPEHLGLADRVAENGALVSEFPPGTPPLPHHFPLRNRIISGLSRAVVVIEAGEKSGSLITAASALDQGRDVMVVPGGVLSGRNRGGHALLRDGACLVECAEDVLIALGGLPAAVRAGVAPAHSSSPADPVLDALEPDEGQSIDELAALTGLGPERLLVRLSELELTGQATRRPGGRFVRSSGKVVT